MITGIGIALGGCVLAGAVEPDIGTAIATIGSSTGGLAIAATRKPSGRDNTDREDDGPQEGRKPASDVTEEDEPGDGPEEPDPLSK
ncbi:hypothetical protein [Streptomyces sp. NPDC088847]|uniref:hypothetical protein n=1 Tax=Streptomyces sp. NPDC088847 TaxID=3365909 RepID=UPI00381BF71E